MPGTYTIQVPYSASLLFVDSLCDLIVKILPRKAVIRSDLGADADDDKSDAGGDDRGGIGGDRVVADETEHDNGN